MSEIIDQFYTPLLIGHGFIRDPDIPAWSIPT